MQKNKKVRSLRATINGVPLLVKEMEKDIYFFVTKTFKVDEDTALYRYGLVVDMSKGVDVLVRSENVTTEDKTWIIDLNNKVEERLIEKYDSIKATFDSKFTIQKYNL